MHPRTCSALIAATALACTGPPPATVEENQPHARIVDPCTDPECNAATVGDDLVFDELALPDRTPILNRAGLWVSDATLHGSPIDLVIEGHDLMGERAGETLRERQLLGLTLAVNHQNGAQYLLRFENLGTTPFWAGPRAEVPLFKITVRKSRQGFVKSRPIGRPPDKDFDHKLCAGAPAPGEDGELVAFAVLFEGDSYDNVKKTVTELPHGTRRFNLACLGTAMAKMHLLRHTRAGTFIERGPRVTQVSERQAMLKMLTADYCGDGRTHTVNGHPLLYQDARGWLPELAASPRDLVESGRARSIEAVWGPDGAVCLNDPRLFSLESVVCGGPPGEDQPRPGAGPTAPSGWRPPPCTALEKWRSQGHLFSANPPRSPIVPLRP